MKFFAGYAKPWTSCAHTYEDKIPTRFGYGIIFIYIGNRNLFGTIQNYLFTLKRSS